MPTALVINPLNQRITFTLPATYADGTTPLPPGAITDIAILVGATPGGPYTKTVKDSTLTPDAGTQVCHYPLASLGVDLTKPSYAVLETEITGPGGVIDSVMSAEVGFQNLAANPPEAVSVD